MFVLDWNIEVVNIVLAISIAIGAKIIATYFSDKIRDLKKEIHDVNTNLRTINYRLLNKKG